MAILRSIDDRALVAMMACVLLGKWNSCMGSPEDMIQEAVSDAMKILRQVDREKLSEVTSRRKGS